MEHLWSQAGATGGYLRGGRDPIFLAAAPKEKPNITTEEQEWLVIRHRRR